MEKRGVDWVEESCFFLSSKSLLTATLDVVAVAAVDAIICFDTQPTSCEIM